MTTTFTCNKQTGVIRSSDVNCKEEAQIQGQEARANW